jgi:hypothetical protein
MVIHNICVCGEKHNVFMLGLLLQLLWIAVNSANTHLLCFILLKNNCSVVWIPSSYISSKPYCIGGVLFSHSLPCWSKLSLAPGYY